MCVRAMIRGNIKNLNIHKMCRPAQKCPNGLPHKLKLRCPKWELSVTVVNFDNTHPNHIIPIRERCVWWTKCHTLFPMPLVEYTGHQISTNPLYPRAHHKDLYLMDLCQLQHNYPWCSHVPLILLYLVPHVEVSVMMQFGITNFIACFNSCLIISKLHLFSSSTFFLHASCRFLFSSSTSFHHSSFRLLLISTN